MGSALLAVVGPTRADEGAPSDGDPAGARALTLAVSPYLPADTLRAAFEPIARHVSRRIGRPIELIIPDSYNATLDLVMAGAVELAYLTPVVYIQARTRNPHLRLLVSDVWEGLDFYTGYIVVRGEDDIDTLTDLRGRRFGYVDPESTSGYLLPRRFLRQAGIDPDAFFSEVRFAGDHLSALRLLLDGEVDAIAIASGGFAVGRRAGLDVGRTALLARTGTVPHDVFVAVSVLPDPLVHAVTRALLELDTRSTEGRRVLPKAPRLNGWRLAIPAEYDVLEALWKEERP